MKVKKVERRKAKNPKVKRIDYTADERFKGAKEEEETKDEAPEKETEVKLIEDKDETPMKQIEDKTAPEKKEGMGLLPLAERNDPSITELKLGNQDHFGNGGARHVASALMKNTHVNLLWVNDNQVEGLYIVLAILSTPLFACC